MPHISGVEGVGAVEAVSPGGDESLVARGLLKPVIADAVSLEGAPEAHRRAEAGEVFGKVLVRAGA